MASHIPAPGEPAGPSPNVNHDNSDSRPNSVPALPLHPVMPAVVVSARNTPSLNGPGSESATPQSEGLPVAAHLHLMPQLQRSGPSVVKTRTGSVLTRGFILKTDYWPSGMTSSRL